MALRVMVWSAIDGCFSRRSVFSVGDLSIGGRDTGMLQWYATPQILIPGEGVGPAVYLAFMRQTDQSNPCGFALNRDPRVFSSR
jgi:hypothetical protein